MFTNELNMLVIVLSIVNLLFLIGGSIGAILFTRRGRKVEIVHIQDETIVALEQQIKAIKDKLSDLERDKFRLQQIIETIQAALLKRGIHVTIDGDLVIVSDTKVSVSAKTQTTRIKKAPEVKDNGA